MASNTLESIARAGSRFVGVFFAATNFGEWRRGEDDGAKLLLARNRLMHPTQHVRGVPERIVRVHLDRFRAHASRVSAVMNRLNNALCGVLVTSSRLEERRTSTQRTHRLAQRALITIGDEIILFGERSALGDDPSSKLSCAASAYDVMASMSSKPAVCSVLKKGTAQSPESP